MATQVGDSAPRFSLKNSNMEDVSLGDFSGKNVVLLLFPWLLPAFALRNFAIFPPVLGISVDTPFSLKAWAEKEGISIPLLSDFNKEVSAAYGAQFADLLGFKGVAKRSAFVVDGEGTIRYASVSDDPTVLPDFAAIKACLKSLN